MFHTLPFPDSSRKPLTVFFEDVFHYATNQLLTISVLKVVVVVVVEGDA